MSVVNGLYQIDLVSEPRQGERYSNRPQSGDPDCGIHRKGQKPCLNTSTSIGSEIKTITRVPLHQSPDVEKTRRNYNKIRVSRTDPINKLVTSGTNVSATRSTYVSLREDSEVTPCFQRSVGLLTQEGEFYQDETLFKLTGIDATDNYRRN